jgi:DNA-binding CsgD family transcriptional regulator
MPDLTTELLDSARLLFDLQRSNEIAQAFAGCLEPELIAQKVTDGLVEKFDIAFARIWLLEADQATLKLVASSGMYTRTNGSFARVPMGAYKVGKIAQNRMSFLSNNLADESWVKDREWAIANNIRGFAGYPLTLGDRVVGVLATFSHRAMAPEFLEVLQVLCVTVAVALDTAQRYQQEQKLWRASSQRPSFTELSLSDQLANILTSARLTLIGTEQMLNFQATYIFLRAAETLNQMGCTYGRLIYGSDLVTLEAIIPSPNLDTSAQQNWVSTSMGDLSFAIACTGGALQTQADVSQKAIQVSFKIPYPSCTWGGRLCIQCRQPVLQVAFTHLAFLAGLTVCETPQVEVPLLTDDAAQLSSVQPVLWIYQEGQVLPKGICGAVTLSIAPTQLREAVEAVTRGDKWGIVQPVEDTPSLSEREVEIMALLVQGLRDRDIASKLIISESTVKFHINNVLAKLKARTRYQALYEVIRNGWIR